MVRVVLHVEVHLKSEQELRMSVQQRDERLLEEQMNETLSRSAFPGMGREKMKQENLKKRNALVVVIYLGDPPKKKVYVCKHIDSPMVTCY